MAHVGNIEDNSCTFSYTTAEADVGAITFDNCDLAVGELSADVGALTLNDCTFEDMELSGDLGDFFLFSSRNNFLDTLISHHLKNHFFNYM